MVADFHRRKRPEIVARTGSRLEQRAYALIVENGFGNYDRFSLLDAAWPTVAPALALFIAGPNPRLQIVCEALRYFFEFTGRWDDWLSIEVQAETKAVASHDHDAAGWRAYWSGWIQYLRGQADAVLGCADRAAAHWQAAQAGARERAFAIRLRGIAYEQKERYPEAIVAYREALNLFRTLNAESQDVAMALSSVGGAEGRSGDYPAAERDFRESLRVSRAVGNHEGVAIDLGNLAGIALRQEDWAGAESLSREALPLSEKLGRRELIGADCHLLAKALIRQGKPSEALPYAQRAVDIFDELHSPRLEAARATLHECES
jgi:tetratricopeptide (TPR) repeat protein